MRSITSVRNSLARYARTQVLLLSGALAAGACAVMPGCAHVPNQWVEDGPGATEPLVSPTAADIYATRDTVKIEQRYERPFVYTMPPQVVTHWPLYFEDPFEDKGHGREGSNKYHLGWEDYVALAYSYPRFTLNWLALPVSMVVTPPWTLMVSDGEISQQLLGYDHDATKARLSAFEEPPGAPLDAAPAAPPTPPSPHGQPAPRRRPAAPVGPQPGVVVEPA